MSDSIPFYGNLNYGGYGSFGTAPSMNQAMGSQSLDLLTNIQNAPLSQNSIQSGNIAQIPAANNEGEKKKKKKKKNKKNKDKKEQEQPENKENEPDNANEQDGQDGNEPGIIKASKTIQKKTLKKLLQNAGKTPEEIRRSKKKGGRKGAHTAGLDSAMFYKTKICPHFLEGSCSKGNNCTFAHSQSELRETPNLKKTKLCQLFQMGKCHLGSSCSYAHGEQELRSTPEFYKTSLCNAFMKGTCKMGDRCRYAHGEHELRDTKRFPNYSVSLVNSNQDPHLNQPVGEFSNSSSYTDNQNPFAGNGFSIGGLPNIQPQNFNQGPTNFAAQKISPIQKQNTFGFSGFEAFQPHSNIPNIQNQSPFGNNNVIQGFEQPGFSYQQPVNTNNNQTSSLQNSFADIGFNTFNPEKLNSLLFS